MNENILLIVFGVVVTAMLMLDLGVFNRKQHIISAKEAGIWTMIWVTVALSFAGFIYYEFGTTKTIEYLSAYVIEKSLSLDNIFVFVLIFNFYKIQEIHKHKILFWGILGAIIFRAIFIFSGLWLIELTYLPELYIFDTTARINVLLTIFAIILIIAGIKSFKKDDGEAKDFGNNIGIRLFKKFIPVTDDMSSGKFIVVKDSIKYMTPLLLALITIEVSDIIFAVDSIPAIFAISKDPIILYTSNIFAILGLRSMYFLLASAISYFTKLKEGIAIILIYIGIKMFIAAFFHIPALVSLVVIISVLTVSILASIISRKRQMNK